MKLKFLAASMALMLAAGSIMAVYQMDALADADTLDVWTTYNTVKVMQDKHDYERLNGGLKIEMAKNEAEGAQLVLTAKQNVSAYNVAVSALTGDGNTLPADSIDVYAQHYVNVVQKSNNNLNYDYPAGYTPDALIPMETVVRYGENVIAEGNNQSVTIEVTTTQDTPAGTYYGTVTVTADGASYAVPLSVTVWNITLESNSRSVFISYPKNYIQGEMDTSLEMQEAYYELMLDNKMCDLYVPGAAYSPEMMINSLKKYWDHPNFTTFSLPTYKGYDSRLANVRYYKQYLRALAEACTPERNYMEKVVNYVWPSDEPWSDGSYDKVITNINALQEAGEEVLAELAGNGFYDQFGAEAESFRAELEADIRGIQLIVTDEYRDTYAETDITFCPTFDKYGTLSMRENLQEHAEEFDNEQWWYGCVNPKYPYPTYHIDDSLIGARAIGWMQKQYGIVGNLFWCVNTYHQWFADVGVDTAIDPYSEVNRIGQSYQVDAAGDGYFFYPGAKYDSETPFSSLRTMTYRDGCDDYDLLCELEEVYTELEKYYAVESGTFSLDNVLQTVFNSIASNVQYSNDASKIYEARRTVAQLIELAQSDAKFVAVSSISSGVTAVHTVYVADGYSVSINGADVMGISQGEGSKYTATQLMNATANYLQVTMTAGENIYEYSQYLGGKRLKITDFSNSSVCGISASEGTTFDAVPDEGKLSFNIVSRGNSLAELMSFKPALTFDKSMFGAQSLNELDTLSFTLYNNSDVDSTVIVRITADATYTDIETLRIAANSYVDVQITGIGDRSWSGFDSASGISFVFDNVDVNNQRLPDRLFAVSEIYISFKEA